MECLKTRPLGRAFVSLGSNLDEPQAQVEQAFVDIAALPATRLLARSSLYRTAPVSYCDQPDFINAVAYIETGLTPHELLDALLDLEHRRGRVRTFRNAPRILDLDVLLYDDLVCHEHGLTVPHPRMHERAFVLLPLLEIAPLCMIPGLGAAADRREGCADQAIERVEASASPLLQPAHLAVVEESGMEHPRRENVAG
jgi:2-amino-4-hydroxy-6-hydroxymethyldihydropteridine diphosphokinase